MLMLVQPVTDNSSRNRMTKLRAARLPERTAIMLTGPEARDFLQRLITADLAQIGPERAGYGALLTPQGKILFDFFIVATDVGFLIDCSTSQRDELVKRLTFYKLRSKVEIGGRETDRPTAAAWGDAAAKVGEGPGAATRLADGTILYRDPRVAEAGVRAVLTARDASLNDVFPDAEVAPPEAYHAHRIALGLADTDADIGSGRMFPHECNLDQFHGVDFAKGCYVGQEVVSRMQHRGTTRKRFVPVRVAGQPPGAGAEIRAAGQSIGTVSSTSGESVLALLRIDRAGQAASSGVALSVNESVLHLVRPPWAGFDVPGAENLP